MLLLIIVICTVVAAVSFYFDAWLGRHPLKKMDAKTEKYRYRGF